MKVQKNTRCNLFRTMSYINTIFLLLCFASSCSSGDAPVADNNVTNLAVEVTLVGADEQNPNGDGSGLIRVTAEAVNATKFAFRFDNGAVLDSDSGTMEYVFSQEGTNTYSVVVWAYSNTGEFINETVSVTVYKSDELFTTLVFYDEFDNEGSLDADKWFHQVIPPNNGSWYNGELQHYTNRSENSIVSNGTLKINAIKEEFTTGGATKSYTSARLNSKYVFTYGKVEVRAKLPNEQGTWPAIWTLGANIDEPGNYFGDEYGSVGWPACGEIDILEQTGWDKSKTLSYFHWGDTNTGEYKTDGGDLVTAGTTEEFHVYSLEWTSTSMIASIDDAVVFELSNTDDKPFDNPHYLLLNLAMGGNLGGDISENFTKDTFEIDYVRIYQ